MRIVYVTQQRFWKAIAGSYARVRSLLRWLGERAEVSVVMERPAPDQLAVLEGWGIPVNYVFLADKRSAASRAPGGRVADAFQRCGDIDVALIDRVASAGVIELLPRDVPAVLDTHDLESMQRQSKAAWHGQSAPLGDFEAEMATYGLFDAVAMIQPEEAALVRRALGDRVVVAPHPVTTEPRTLRPEARRLGFFASGFYANVDGLGWFLDSVWPSVRARTDASFHLVGSLCKRPPHPRLDDARIIVEGLVEETADAYELFDVMVNPTAWGSGLKIKTVEALGAGLPQICRSEGARGLQELAGTALLVSDDAEEFADHIIRVIDQPDLREALHVSSRQWASRQTPDACFGALYECLEALVESANAPVRTRHGL